MRSTLTTLRPGHGKAPFRAAKAPGGKTTGAAKAGGATAAGSKGRQPTSVDRNLEKNRTARQARRRDQILDAALNEFSARGFAAARLDDVAVRAGVAKGTIYLYFRDKE